MTGHSHPLQPFFDPASVAIIGASSDPDKLGGRPIRYLRDAGYAGHIYPINPKADTVQGLRAYASLADVPGPVDQALIIVPAAAAQQALQACIDKGIRHVQVLSSGFAEEDDAGRQRQDDLAKLATAHGVRLTGPNCLGIVSVANRFYATFSTALEALVPQAGGISFATQSGAFGSCAYAQAIQRGLGIARIVATGNEVDVDVAQCIDFLASDPHTQVICAAIEGCRDGDVLRRALLKAAAAAKPVILMKVGASARGQQAAATHTGAVAGNDRVFDAVARECGAWRAGSIEQMLDIAYLCTHLPRPANARAGVVTVSGGIGVLMADDAERCGVDMPALPADVQAHVHERVPFAIGANPLDTTAQIGVIKNGLTDLVGLLLRDTDWSTLFVYMAQIPCDERRFPPMLEELAKLREQHPDRLIVLVGPHSEAMRAAIEAQRMVIFADPGRAMAAVGAACGLQARRRDLPGVATVSDTSRADPLVPLPAPGTRLDEWQAKQVLQRYGLPMLRETLCADADDAVRAAQAAGYPVAAKIVSVDVPHKTEIGGVLLNLRDDHAVRQAFHLLRQRGLAHASADRIAGVLIAPMSAPGTETILGIHMDPLFGPMVMFGLGGVAVELFQDVAFASAPLTEARAAALIESVRSARLLQGWRGQAAVDIAALRQALMALSRFAHDWRAVLSGVDVNPFVLRPDGAVCLDALITLRGAVAQDGS
ncbi:MULTISPECIES: acetate--CoA ligase family protein [unclassified Achromobacter]|uniref:acetate--CoA ligase family protein n=1 Tax=unclassified Achromobacter TaxID=2626865 RepID=UPI000B51DF34|nr:MULTISPECIES: acetate--CoA ligase family protein [unclassified Achromobacter]OWT73589.1 CoA-binding protein [Achromobacter sp. HZ34]OWT79494.1 CoA-binding protein [Achromobacter sp. HZ28]